MPNIFAYTVLFIWPIVVMWLVKHYKTNKSVFLCLLISILILPTALTIDIPFLPPIDKDTITSYSLIIFLFLFGKKFHVLKREPITYIAIGYFVVLLISTLLNDDLIIANGDKALRSLTIYDAFSSIFRMYIWYIPFFLGKQYANKIEDNEYFFKIFVALGLMYTIPMLLEIRFSPQLHNLIYGFHPHEFIQQMREGGFRPMVFVGHGLRLSFIFATFIIAGFALHKNKIKLTKKINPLITLIYLITILILCKTWSSTLYALIAYFLIFYFSPNKQVKLSLFIACLVVLYPISKAMEIFPDKEIVSYVKSYNSERAQSLEFRLVNETALLHHALERPYFGWGGWGRNLLYDEIGRDASTTDGVWIIEFGNVGAIGFLIYYAFLITPLVYANKIIKYIKEPKEKVYFSTLAIILMICLLDSIPNSGMLPIHLFLAGALLGQSQTLAMSRKLALNKPINK